MSFVESGVNIGVGILTSMVANACVFPLLDIHINLSTNVQLTLIYTGISLARSYTLRRLFNRWHN
jgi:hypothetical protein